MAIALRAVGTVASGTAAISPGLPAGSAADDVCIMVCETNATITASGWTEAASSPQDEPSDGTHLTVFWRRLTSGSDATTTSDSGNHQIAQIIGFTGVITSGTPLEATAGSTDTTPANPAQIPGVTSLTDGAMIVYVIGTGDDRASTTKFSSWTNASLVSITEGMDQCVATADGGGFGLAYGIKTTAGATGTTTVTESTPVTNTYWSGALKPAAAGGSTLSITVSDTITITESIGMLKTEFISVSDSITITESVRIANIAPTSAITRTAQLRPRIFAPGIAR